MSVRRIRTLTVLAAVGGMAVALAAGSPMSQAVAGAARPAKAADALVSVAGPTGQFQRNLQVMPTMAVNPANPRVLAATANDLMDLQACSREAAITGASCGLPADPQFGGTFNAGVGLSGVYFSFNSGRRWTQPTYQGLTAAGCDPTVEPCKAQPGPIHTVPNYYENGLRAAGGTSVAFGPVLRNGKFSWKNGSRLYLSTLGTNLTGTPLRPGSIDTTRAVMVSHLDDPTPARVTDQSNWSAPVIVPERAPAVSRPTEDQIWADNASSSRFFGNVYTCYNDFLFLPFNGNVGPLQPTVGVSSDGGKTWGTRNVVPPINSASEGYRLGCTIRTDSHGVVYAFFTRFPGLFPSFDTPGSQTMVKSFDGGATWTQPTEILSLNTGCFYVDPISHGCAEEGSSGTLNIPGPSVGIANGAPTGAGATNEIMFTWADGRSGQNHEAALLSYSTDRGRTWSAPATVSTPGDRVLYPAVAIAPDASRVYLTYNAFTTPFNTPATTPRLLHGVMRTAAIGRGGAPAGWTTNYVGRTGDARGTSFAVWNYPEFLGFFSSAVATRDYGAGAWTDVSHIADCPAIDAWRKASIEAGTVLTPAPWPQTDCPANFGNSDIRSATTAP